MPAPSSCARALCARYYTKLPIFLLDSILVPFSFNFCVRVVAFWSRVYSCCTAPVSFTPFSPVPTVCHRRPALRICSAGHLRAHRIPLPKASYTIFTLLSWCEFFCADCRPTFAHTFAYPHVFFRPFFRSRVLKFTAPVIWEISRMALEEVLAQPDGWK